MSGDYVPHSETELAGWARAFVERTQAHEQELGIPPAVLDKLETLQGTFQAALLDSRAAQAAAAAVCRTKDDAKNEFVKLARSVAQQIQANPNTTDGMRAELGLSVRDGANGVEPLPVSHNTPKAIISINSRMRHVLRVFNQTGTSTAKSRPAGTRGCEVWRTIGNMPESMAEMEYVDLITRNPFVIDYSGEDAGKQAHYVLRWVSTSGEKGPWSATESATIAA